MKLFLILASIVLLSVVGLTSIIPSISAQYMGNVTCINANTLNFNDVCEMEHRKPSSNVDIRDVIVIRNSASFPTDNTTLMILLAIGISGLVYMMYFFESRKNNRSLQ